jgi:hypothetical protein
MTANAPLLRATSMYPRREFLEPLGQTARRLRAIVAEVKAQDALAPGDRKISATRQCWSKGSEETRPS